MPAATPPAAAASSSEDAGVIVTLMSWNAASVLPAGKNAGKLWETLELLPHQPDIIWVLETKHVKVQGGCVDKAKTCKQVEAIAALLETGV